MMHQFHPHHNLCITLVAVYFILSGSYTGVISLPEDDSTNNRMEDKTIDNAISIQSSRNVTFNADDSKSVRDSELGTNNVKDTSNEAQLITKATDEGENDSSQVNLLSNLATNNDLTDVQNSSSIKKATIVTKEPEKLNTTNISSKESILTSTSSSVTEKNDVVLEGTTPAEEHHTEPTFSSVIFGWMKDSYTLSILIPVASGAGAALAFLITVTLFIYLRRRCRLCRRKRRRLPESVRKMRLDDRKILLEGTSDEEF